MVHSYIYTKIEEKTDGPKNVLFVCMCSASNYVVMVDRVDELPPLFICYASAQEILFFGHFRRKYRNLS